MSTLNGWDWCLLGAAGFIATSVLVRLMRSHRNKVLGEFRGQMQQEHKASKAKAAANERGSR